MAHELAEQLSGLASRVNNLVINHTGDDSRSLLDLQNQLLDLVQKVIIQDFDDEQPAYRKALSGLQQANSFIGDAEESIDNIAKAIGLVSKAIDLVEKALTEVAKL